jgi:hypothetical protein
MGQMQGLVPLPLGGTTFWTGSNLREPGFFMMQPVRGFCHSHTIVTSADYLSHMSYDPATIATLRRALDEVVSDSRFRRRKSASALEMAEHLLAQAAAGERDLERLKSSAFKKLTGSVDRLPNRPNANVLSPVLC